MTKGICRKPRPIARAGTPAAVAEPPESRELDQRAGSGPHPRQKPDKGKLEVITYNLNRVVKDSGEIKHDSLSRISQAENWSGIMSSDNQLIVP